MKKKIFTLTAEILEDPIRIVKEKPIRFDGFSSKKKFWMTPRELDRTSVNIKVEETEEE